MLGTASASDVAEVQRSFEAKRLEYIVDCMASAGFKFFATDPSNSVQVYRGPDRQSLEYARTYGFGVSTNPAPTLSDSDPADKKNREYIAGLSDEAQAAYGRAATDCDAQSSDSFVVDPESATLRKQFEEVVGRLRASDEYLGLVQAWKQCARGVGVQAEGLEQLTNSFADRLGALSGDEAALNALRKAEVEAAVATHECNVAYVEGYASAYRSMGASATRN